MWKLFLCLAAMLSGSAISAQLRDYSAGQVWEYRTADGDQGSLIKIQEIETIGAPDNQRDVFHISMTNIHLPDGSLIPAIEHLPVSRETLDRSVTRLSIRSDVFPDHRAGLKEWRDANGGVFTISLAEIGDVLRHSILGALERQQESE